jgi:hypothetical protein
MTNENRPDSLTAAELRALSEQGTVKSFQPLLNSEWVFWRHFDHCEGVLT